VAITRYDYLFWKELRDDGVIPSEPHILELGQANWYGDIDPKCLVDDVKKYASTDDVEGLLDRLKDPGTPEEPILFIQAGVFYGALIKPVEWYAIDHNGTPKADRLDLNYPVDFRDLDVVINTGTAEHVFNQFQFFKTAHDACKNGGIMVHMLPAWGWLDHGFYNYHPTFVADLAAANGYHIQKWWLYDLGESWHHTVQQQKYVSGIVKERGMTGSALHAVCYVKQNDEPFRMPIQGYYAGTLDPEQEIAWHKER
jgi:hypothetical protein